ncbi:NfeD family protein [Barnesiella intestinihominis]|jgi:hypothetical protein|nr:hypothetical protein [Barnesiella intestinihominis]
MDIIISSWLLWLIIAAILVIIELLTSMIATFCLATGCLIAMVCALLDWGVEAQLIGAIIGTVIAFILVQTKRGKGNISVQSFISLQIPTHIEYKL